MAKDCIVVQCRNCVGKGFTEEQGGTIMRPCLKCAGKGRVKRRIKVEANA